MLAYRDIHCRFVLDLEDLLETYNPEYVRSTHQHVPAVWSKTLGHGKGGDDLHGKVDSPYLLFMQMLKVCFDSKGCKCTRE